MYTLAPFVGQHDVHDAAIIFVALARDQLFLFETVDNAGEIADGDHHFCADFAEGQPTGVADRRQHVKLWRRETNFV